MKKLRPAIYYRFEREIKKDYFMRLDIQLSKASCFGPVVFGSVVVSPHNHDIVSFIFSLSFSF